MIIEEGDIIYHCGTPGCKAIGDVPFDYCKRCTRERKKNKNIKQVNTGPLDYKFDL